MECGTSANFEENIITSIQCVYNGSMDLSNFYGQEDFINS